MLQGFVCPACGGLEFWRTGTGLWMCRDCQRRTSVTAGTIFHRTRTPLSTWFAAIWFVTSQNNGISAQGLQRVLFASYETAWAWLHKLRRAMVRPDRDLLRGIVEVDETMVGGVSPGMFGGASGKVRVMIAVEHNDGRRLGRVHLVASLLKRWFIGTSHYRVEIQQMPYYLDEYTFRFNRRTSKSRGLLFYRLLQQAVRTDPHPLGTLLKPDLSDRVRLQLSRYADHMFYSR